MKKQMKLKKGDLFKLYKIIVCSDIFLFILIVMSLFMFNNIGTKVHNQYFLVAFSFLGVTVALAPFYKLKKMRLDDEVILTNKYIVDKMIYGELRDYIAKPLFVLFTMICILIVNFIFHINF
jgi:hypothetical protein